MSNPTAIGDSAMLEDILNRAKPFEMATLFHAAYAPNPVVQEGWTGCTPLPTLTEKRVREIIREELAAAIAKLKATP